jgi:hypothetical protein
MKRLHVNDDFSAVLFRDLSAKEYTCTKLSSNAFSDEESSSLYYILLQSVGGYVCPLLG